MHELCKTCFFSEQFDVILISHITCNEAQDSTHLTSWRVHPVDNMKCGSQAKRMDSPGWFKKNHKIHQYGSQQNLNTGDSRYPRFSIYVILFHYYDE